MSARLEENRHGLALTNGESSTPFGYEREGNLVITINGRKLVASPDDLEQLARDLRNRKASKVWRV